MIINVVVTMNGIKMPVRKAGFSTIHPGQIMTLAKTITRLALAAACAISSPAIADTTAFTMSPAWQKIASAGATVDVQNTSSSTAYLTTSSTAPAGQTGQVLVGGDHRMYTLTTDLYALGSGSGSVVVTGGIAGSGSGGGGGGSVTQGTSPWVENIAQIGGSAVALGQAAMAASLPVAVASNQTLNVASVGNGNLATTQATVTAASTLIVAARAGRNSVTIENTGSTAVYLGPSGVTVSNGLLLPGGVGASVTIPTSAAIYAITASGSQVIALLETY